MQPLLIDAQGSIGNQSSFDAGLFIWSVLLLGSEHRRQGQLLNARLDEEDDEEKGKRLEEKMEGDKWGKRARCDGYKKVQLHFLRRFIPSSALIRPYCRNPLVRYTPRTTSSIGRTTGFYFLRALIVKW